jgi:signal transduction histidine kinase/ligand-binding sensor domain-containing protein
MGSPTRLALWHLMTCLLCLRGQFALALNPALEINQYAHTAWRVGESFAKADIHTIAQTPDGFLWFGTDVGLIRFDGVSATRWKPPEGSGLPDSRIRVLLSARDGTLWIGTWRGLASWSRGQLVTHPEFAEHGVFQIVEDRNGAVWISAGSRKTGTGVLCAIRSAAPECYGRDRSFGKAAPAIYEDRHGSLWLGTGNDLWHWQPGAPQRYSLPEPLADVPKALAETPSGELLFLTSKGVFEFADGKVLPYWRPQIPEWQLESLLTDGDGAVWIGTDQGLLHLHGGRIDVFDHADGLPGGEVSQSVEDREGNIWVISAGGLNQFHDLAATKYSIRQGLVGRPCAVLADRDGSVWFSTTEGLYRLQGGHTAVYRARHESTSTARMSDSHESVVSDVRVTAGLPEDVAGSLFQDHRGRIWLGTRLGLGYLEHGRFVSVTSVPHGYIDSIAEDRAGNLWVAHRDAGILELSSDRVLQQIPWSRIGWSGFGHRLAVDAVHGGLWIGFASGGVVHVADGRVRAAYGASEGLGQGQINEVRVASDGTVWIASEGGLSRMRAGHFDTLDARAGLPCDHVDASIEDEDSVWLYTACGLVRISESDLQAWTDEVGRGKGRQSRVRVTVLDSSDGIRTFYDLPTFSPHLAKTTDGKLWLVTLDGLSVLDPHHPTSNRSPPPVYVGRIVADRTAYETSAPLKLPPLVRNLEINYTALSLVAPEKNQFRYQLEGHDSDWQDVGNRRQAFYNDLPPGNYRFRVIASNNSGVWNEQGATLDFTIAPAYWQKSWFRALCAIAIVGILWALYQLRLRQLTRTFNMTLEARVGERTRIARDLHDTLLQSFQGLLLRFQTVADLLPTRPTEAKRIVVSAVDQAAQAITEGRHAVEGLRTSAAESTDLPGELRTLGELAAAETHNESVGLTVDVEGTPRALKPIVRDEIYRIAGEALRNAFRHAAATRIELELRYDERQLRLRVRDDGRGIEPKVLSEATEGEIAGHHGLRGMRERASLIGGKLTVWTAPDSGTEVELIVRASRVYARSASRGRSWLAQRFARKSA